MELILSGIGSAIIAALITILLQCWFDKVRERKAVILKTVAWIDKITTRLQALSAYKLIISRGENLPISNSKYDALSNELRLAILSNLVFTEIRCAYGDGKIMRKIIELHNDLTTASRMLWTSTLAEWPIQNDQITNLFTKTIDPKIENIMKDLFYSLQIMSIVCKHA